jgi:hypothetical protein
MEKLRYCFTFLDLGTRQRWVINFVFGEDSSRNRWIRWVGPRAVLKLWSRENALASAENRTPAVQPDSISTEPRLMLNAFSRNTIWWCGLGSIGWGQVPMVTCEQKNSLRSWATISFSGRFYSVSWLYMIKYVIVFLASSSHEEKGETLRDDYVCLYATTYFFWTVENISGGL